MTTPSHTLRASYDRILLEEMNAAVEEFEVAGVGQGRVPDTRRLLNRRPRILIEICAGVLLGVNVAVIALLLTFLVVNKALHLTF